MKALSLYLKLTPPTVNPQPQMLKREQVRQNPRAKGVWKILNPSTNRKPYILNDHNPIFSMNASTDCEPYILNDRKPYILNEPWNEP